MVKIHNCLHQRLIINLSAGNNLDIFAGGTAIVSKEDLNSPHLKGLITRGDIMVRSGDGSDKAHPIARSEPKKPPAVTEDTAVQPEPVKETKTQPEAGMEAKTRPDQTGKGELTNANPKKVSNPKTPLKESAGKK